MNTRLYGLHDTQVLGVVSGLVDNEFQVSCETPGAKWVIFTCTACFLLWLNGRGHNLKETSSPSFGTYSPSILEKTKRMCVYVCIYSDMCICKHKRIQWVKTSRLYMYPFHSKMTFHLLYKKNSADIYHILLVLNVTSLVSLAEKRAESSLDKSTKR